MRKFPASLFPLLQFTARFSYYNYYFCSYGEVGSKFRPFDYSLTPNSHFSVNPLTSTLIPKQAQKDRANGDAVDLGGGATTLERAQDRIRSKKGVSTPSSSSPGGRQHQSRDQEHSNTASDLTRSSSSYTLRGDSLSTVSVTDSLQNTTLLQAQDPGDSGTDAATLLQAQDPGDSGTDAGVGTTLLQDPDDIGTDAGAGKVVGDRINSAQQNTGENSTVLQDKVKPVPRAALQYSKDDICQIVRSEMEPILQVCMPL